MIELSLTNDMLETACQPWDFNNPPMDAIELNDSLTLFREEKIGLGLAANQVGIPYKVISVKGMDTCMFNPHIVFESETKQFSEEGCLSFPGLVVKIKRSDHIRVRFADVFGNHTIKSFMGLTARIIAHECDHLSGVHFYSRANKFHREQAFRQWRKRKKLAETRNV